VIDFKLRDAALCDSADIARLVRDLAEYERLADEAVATAEDFERYLFGPAARGQAMVAELSGRVVGIAIWFYNFNTFTCRPGLYVEDVFVEPAHRGCGIGRAFFRAMARRAVQEGCSRMEWSVLDWNAPAIAFYRSMGAVGMEEWTVQRLSADKLASLAGES
jgi:GNAT superfamily N-acetyltransferase